MFVLPVAAQDREVTADVRYLAPPIYLFEEGRHAVEIGRSFRLEGDGYSWRYWQDDAQGEITLEVLIVTNPETATVDWTDTFSDPAAIAEGKRLVFLGTDEIGQVIFEVLEGGPDFLTICREEGGLLVFPTTKVGEVEIEIWPDGGGFVILSGMLGDAHISRNIRSIAYRDTPAGRMFCTIPTEWFEGIQEILEAFIPYTQRPIQLIGGRGGIAVDDLFMVSSDSTRFWRYHMLAGQLALQVSSPLGWTKFHYGDDAALEELFLITTVAIDGDMVTVSIAEPQ